MMYASENQDWDFLNFHPPKDNFHCFHSLPFSRADIKHQIHISSIHTPLETNMYPEKWLLTILLLKCSLFKGCFVHFRGSIICKARAEMSSFRFTSWSSPEIRPRFQMTSIYKAVCVVLRAQPRLEKHDKKHSDVTSNEKNNHRICHSLLVAQPVLPDSWEDFDCFSGGIRWSNIAVSSMGLFAKHAKLHNISVR